MSFREPINIDSLLTFDRSSVDNLLVILIGEWRLPDIPSVDHVYRQVESAPELKRIAFQSDELKMWDSGLLIFLVKLVDTASRKGIAIDKNGLPGGVQRLLALASAVPDKKSEPLPLGGGSFFAVIGDYTLRFRFSMLDLLTFMGEVSTAFVRMVRGKARFRRSDLMLAIQECGMQALPIVSLISLLVGLILAFVGSIQLRMFGAQIYIANLVGIAMVREMAAIMTGIIMAGRTGAAFAAQIGTMQVNEEIDALKTMGISPIEFLVLPRMIALFLMLPLLAVYADLMGILGGFLVGVFMLDLNTMQYYHQTCEALTLNDFWVGIFMSAVFGVLVALAGCMRGMQCGRNASAVGEAATSAVVTGIVSVIVATAVITIICNALKI